MGVTTTNPTARQRPKTSAPYLTASAAYRAGFRGWPLVVMTAIAGRESSWNPTALNNTPATGDYSIGLWQLNYFGSLGPARTKEYGYSSSQLRSSPQDQANEAFQLAGGNQLVGLGNWALISSPASGVVPNDTAQYPGPGGKSTLLPYMPQALSAASEVGTFGPASAQQIAQGSTWPGATPLGSALTSGGASISGPPPGYNSYATTGHTCATGGSNQSGILFKFGSFGMTWCQLKAITGGAILVAGGVVTIIGVTSLLVGSFGGRSKGAAAIAPVILVARAGGRGVRAVRPRRSSPEPEVQEEAA